MCQTSGTPCSVSHRHRRKETLTSPGSQARAERLPAQIAAVFLNQNDRYKKPIVSLRDILSF